MTPHEKHRMAVRLFGARQPLEALTLLRELLAESESSELWSDWAAVQFSLHRAGEAERGFRLALEMEPGNAQAAFNLGVLLARTTHPQDARPFLITALGSLDPAERTTAQHLLARLAATPQVDAGAEKIETYLRSFLSDSLNEQSYFETHVRRYVATLQELPLGGPGARLLELGAAFHHLTPALRRFRAYDEVRCTDVWEGAARETRTVAARDGGESCTFTVDNFDLQRLPWPYRDGEFDAVLCCEILEHLYSDPMGLMAEMNRVLRPGGALLLTTPNLASAHAVAETIRGGSPYAYGKFELGGKPTDRHNREYTAAEVARLAVAAGFAVSAIRTFDFYWPEKREVFRLLASQGASIAGRGDSTFLSARKHAAVVDRYPEELYARVGIQASRRQRQANDDGQHESPEATVAAALPKSILLVHEILPHYDCSGADLRLYELVRELRAQHHRVTFLARDGRDDARYRPPLEALGAQVYSQDAERLRYAGQDAPSYWELRDVLRHGQFDLAILSHWFWSGVSVAEQYIDEIRRHSPATRVLVLSEDRHGERERRAAQLSGHLSDFERATEFEQRETEIYRRADMVLFVSEIDQQRFLELVPDLVTAHLPTMSESASAGPEFAAREGVLFLGNFENPANRDALAWMLDHVWPAVRKQEPDLTLYIAGNAAPEGLQTKYPGTACVGKVPDLGPQFDLRRVFVAPIRYGTGIITKNMHAIAHGLPVVTTSVGAEGLQLRDGEHAMIADDPARFAAAIVRLYRDQALWEKLAAGGRAHLRAKFSLENLQAQIRKIVGSTGSLRARAATTAQPWSYRLVEDASPSVLTQQPAHYRPLLRTLAYWQLGRQFLAAGHAAQALEQFRHVFTFVRGAMPVSVFHTALLRDMARAYRLLGEEESARRCEKEHAACVWPWKTRLAEKTSVSAKSAATENKPEISVVLPTFNRCDILRLCLSSLAFTSLPAERWEVVVVDDGSTDGTAALCRETAFPFSLRYVRQENSGAGAARRAGVAAANGEYLLLCNDDTIVSSNLLVEHLSVQRRRKHEKLAVLGDFRHSEDVVHRALSLFINTSGFFFPQRRLKTGQTYDQAYFVTCNLSVRRDAVLAVGNFDPRFRVAEDTELGARLVEQGLRVVYHPDAVAWHEHASFTSQDLVRRARSYGHADWDLFQKHPRLLGDGQGPFGALQPQDRARLQDDVARHRVAVANSLTALEALDALDFRALTRDEVHGRANAEDLLRKVGQLALMVHWHFVFERFLERWQAAESAVPETPAEPRLQVQAQRG